MMSDFSVIKWDNKNNEEILTIARKLIFVSHNAERNSRVEDLLEEFSQLQKNIKEAEKALFTFLDRHQDHSKVKKLETAHERALDASLHRMPKVFAPCPRGGAIPVEAARWACN